jgi:DNA-binding SARP family transcriptional activator/Flp pilus assembly protein TadD
MSKAEKKRSGAPLILEVRLLGPFRIMVGGTLVEESRWSRRKPKQVFKLLALQPHHQLHREQLMETLWPEQEPESASNSLHKAIHLARRALEPELHSAADSHFILTQGQQIILSAPGGVQVDVEDFEHAAASAIEGGNILAYESALELYRGDLLPEDRYEDWVATRREPLGAIYQELLMRLARLYEARGQYGQSVARFKEIIERDPANEEAHRHLMRLYAGTHHRQQALRQYEACRAALRKELDAEPEPATVELHGQIIAGLVPALQAAKEHATQRDAAINSLAIFPFINMSGNPASEYLSDGITESIINMLSRLPQLKVMARSTVFRYKGMEIDPQEVGRRLGVRAVVTGRVLQRGKTLNVQAELVEVSDGSQIWGEQYSRSASDIFEVQEGIAREIAGKLRLKLSGEEKLRLSKRYTENTEAYRLYLKGRHHWNKRTVEYLEKGLECFRQAIKIDPDYALAHAGISDCYAFLGDVGLTAVPSREAFAKAREAARLALDIDDTLAEAHNSLGHVLMHDFDWPGAEKSFKRALELNQNNATAHQWYAYYLLFRGHSEEAVAEAARGLELDPLSLAASGDMGQILYYTRQYDACIEQFQKTLELDPYFYRQHLWLGWAYEQKRMYEAAAAEFQRAGALAEENTEVLISLGCVYALSGRKSEALTLLAKLKALSASTYVSPYNMAVLYLRLGEKSSAFEWLDRAYREQAEWMIYLGVDPRFDELRADPRFGRILQRIGFDLVSAAEDTAQTS